jgi:DNA-binding MarR family transcriptional regulator
MKLIDENQLSPALLLKAANLRNSTKRIFVELCKCKEPQSVSAIAELVGESRAYVNMRLLQLVDQDYVKEVHVENSRKKMFMVVQ